MPKPRELLRCGPDCECNECEEVDDLLYCHYGIRPVEVDRGQECRHKFYKFQIPEYFEALRDVPRMTLQQELEKYGRKT